MAPGAETILICRALQDTEGRCTCIDTSDWRTRWSIPLPPFKGGVVGCCFLTPERYIIAAREVSLWQTSNLVWKTHLPTPVEFPTDETRRVAWPDESEWMLLSCSDPTTDGEHVYVRAHWARRLGSNGYFYENEWDDRSSVEILSMHDGKWLRREEVQSGAEPSVAIAPAARDHWRLIDSQRIELLRDGIPLGVLEASPDLRIVDADWSMSDLRVVVVLANGRFALFEIVE
jgi:hypothetical protein